MTSFGLKKYINGTKRITQSHLNFNPKIFPDISYLSFKNKNNENMGFKWEF
jgi:hypothetical protein